MFRFLVLLTLGTLLPVSVDAVPRSYGATEHQSKWLVSTSPLECRLRHVVPSYGEARFEKEAGGELGFTLHVFQRPFRTGQARLLSVPPAWKHDAVTRDLGTVDFVDDKPPFRLPRPSARRLLAELEQGMFPTLSFKDWADGSDEIKVYLSSVNVRKALGEFRACLSGILPFTFETVRFSRLHFGFGEKLLKGEHQRRLAEIARYVTADERIKRIELEAHTDSRGYRKVNRALGQRRAEAVRDYLIAQGVAPGLFTIKSYGEAKPIASNRSVRGRELNRRVEITLVR